MNYKLEEMRRNIAYSAKRSMQVQGVSEVSERIETALEIDRLRKVPEDLTHRIVLEAVLCLPPENPRLRRYHNPQGKCSPGN